MRFIFAIWLLAVSAQAALVGNEGWDYEARRWQTNIVNSAGTISANSYIVGTEFMQNVKRWALRPKLGRVNLYLGNDTNALQCPIIHDWFNASDGNDDLVAFVASDYSETNGLTGNTTTKHLRCNGGSGLSLASFTDGRNVHFADYCRTASNEASDITGASTALGTWALVHGNAGNTYVFMGANITSAADSLGSGCYIASRTETNFAATYKNATAIVTDSTTDSSASGPLPSVSVVVHALNVNGVISAITSRTLSYYGIGFGIPASMITPYNTAITLVQKGAGRAL
jgi:hypothetical protein